jgi:methylmalonyl-CoA mutase cobalamin-binding subunit
VGRGDCAVFVSVSDPAASTDLLNRADKLICRHGRKIVVVVGGVIGVSLLAKGLSILLGR